jgi:hypothetical protein
MGFRLEPKIDDEVNVLVEKQSHICELKIACDRSARVLRPLPKSVTYIRDSGKWISVDINVIRRRFTNASENTPPYLVPLSIDIHELLILISNYCIFQLQRFGEESASYGTFILGYTWYTLINWR